MVNSIYSDMLAPVIEHSNKMFVPESDDYTGADGLLYCGKCGTRRETVLSDNRVVKTLCKCRKTERDKRELEEKIQKRERIRQEQLCNQKYLQMTFDHSDCELGFARKYADNWDYMYKNNTGLLLYGNAGTGKTYAAAAIANRIIDKTPLSEPEIVNNTVSLASMEEIKKYRVYMNDMASLVHLMSDTYGGGYDKCVKMMRESALVVIDDIGVERNTEYANEKSFEILNTRIESGKPLIVTTNIDVQRLNNPETLHERRIFSRLMSLQIIPVTGADKRVKQMTETRNDIKSILGIR